jgi:hypothetical protein
MISRKRVYEEKSCAWNEQKKPLNHILNLHSNGLRKAF